HNRYLHSIGTMDVAGRWHEKLLDSNKNKSPEAEIEREFLRIAALLHDYGHLPFSHLFEEIFDELHWFPSPRRERSRHEVRTRWKFDKLLEERLGSKGTVREYIKERLGYEPDDIVNLIDGCCGKAYLDAIVNSPLDADKIDYIFRDLCSSRASAARMPSFPVL
ncbi:MAG: HD domain-containing protein, partial [Gammaproteobacteria bacterium]